MKLVIQRNDLLIPLQKVIGAIEKRQTMPMLGNVLIESGNGQVRFSATDLEITLQAHIDHFTNEDGAVTLPARKLLDICKALPESSEITIEADAEKGTIRTRNSRFTLVCLPAEDFPSLESSSMSEVVEVSAETLKTLLEKTAFAMANQDVRYYLNGLMLEVFPQGLRGVATDGHRLALCEVEANIGEDGGTGEQVIVPRKGVMELLRLLGDENGLVRLSLGSRHIQVTTDRGQFTSKLIDGKFPDYQRVIPKDADNRIVASRSSFRESLQRTAILSNEKYRGIRLVIRTDNLTLQAHNSEQEEAEESLEVSYEGDDLSIGFNVQYLLDVANVMKGDEIQLALKDSNSSVLLTEPGDKASKYVIMPMRL